MSARPMPHDLGAERALLGAALTNADEMAHLFSDVAPDDFYLPQHAALWQLLRTMYQNNEPIDLVTVHMRGAPKLFGSAEWAGLPEHCPSAAAAPSYARGVRDAAVRRRMLVALQEATAACYEGDVEELGGEVASRILAASAGKRTDTWSMADLWRESEREADEIHRGVRTAPSERVVSTGYGELDAILRGGLRGGDLAIVGGATSMGKSSLAMGIWAAGVMAGYRMVYISNEPRKPEWFQRGMAALTGLPLELCRPARVNDRTQRQWDLVEAYSSSYLANMENSSLVFKPRLTLDMAVGAAKRHALGGQVDLVVVDHLHLMDHRKRGSDSLVEAIARTSSGLKQLGGELNAPVLCLAQLNRAARAVDAYKNRPRTSDQEWWDAVSLPVPEDIRDCGAIEQDADIIMFPVRAEKAGPGGNSMLGDGVPDNAAVLKVAKQRNGRTGRIALMWDADRSVFCSRHGVQSTM